MAAFAAQGDGLPLDHGPALMVHWRLGDANRMVEASPESAKDGDLAALYAEPFRILHPFRQTVPFVFASPHSGRTYPAGFVAASRLSATSLRRSEDAFVDELFCGAVALGAPMIAARFPRAFLDANRAPSELDSAMFDGVLRMAVDTPKKSGLDCSPVTPW